MSNKSFYDPDQQNATMDLSGVDGELGFQPLPKGNYAVEIDECEFKESSNGNPMIMFKFKVIDHEKYADRYLWEHCVLNNEFGVKKLKVLLARWFPTLNLSDFDPNSFSESGEAIGVKGIVKLSVKTKKGEEPRNNINDFLAYDENAAAMSGNAGW